MRGRIFQSVREHDIPKFSTINFEKREMYSFTSRWPLVDLGCFTPDDEIVKYVVNVWSTHFNRRMSDKVWFGNFMGITMRNLIAPPSSSTDASESPTMYWLIVVWQSKQASLNSQKTSMRKFLQNLTWLPPNHHDYIDLLTPDAIKIAIDNIEPVNLYHLQTLGLELLEFNEDTELIRKITEEYTSTRSISMPHLITAIKSLNEDEIEKLYDKSDENIMPDSITEMLPQQKQKCLKLQHCTQTQIKAQNRLDESSDQENSYHKWIDKHSGKHEPKEISVEAKETLEILGAKNVPDYPSNDMFKIYIKKALLSFGAEIEDNEFVLSWISLLHYYASQTSSMKGSTSFTSKHANALRDLLTPNFKRKAIVCGACKNDCDQFQNYFQCINCHIILCKYCRHMQDKDIIIEKLILSAAKLETTESGFNGLDLMAQDQSERNEHHASCNSGLYVVAETLANPTKSNVWKIEYLPVNLEILSSQESFKHIWQQSTENIVQELYTEIRNSGVIQNISIDVLIMLLHLKLVKFIHVNQNTYNILSQICSSLFGEKSISNGKEKLQKQTTNRLQKILKKNFQNPAQCSICFKSLTWVKFKSAWLKKCRNSDLVSSTFDVANYCSCHIRKCTKCDADVGFKKSSEDADVFVCRNNECNWPKNFDWSAFIDLDDSLPMCQFPFV